MEKFEPKDLAEVDRARKVIDTQLSKKKPKKQKEYLQNTAEVLQDKRNRLIEDAQIEARLLNILYDFGDIDMRPSDEVRGIEDYLNEYFIELKQILNRSGRKGGDQEKIEKLKAELLSIYDQVTALLKKESLEEADFESFTDLLLKLKDIRSLGYFERKNLIYKTEAEVSEPDTEEETGQEQIKKINVSDIEYVRSKNYGYGRYASSQILVTGVDESGNEITAYADRGLREALDVQQLNQNRFEVIKNYLPKKLRVIAKPRTYDGTYYYVIHPDDIEAWANQIIAAVPEISQKIVKDEFLPPGKNEESDSPVEQGPGGHEPSISDPERIRFLRTLGPIDAVDTQAFNSNRVYSAFIFQRGERKVAVVATDKTQNADYLFWADNDDWIPVAQKTKLEVRTQPDPLFIGRSIHSKNWQKILEDYLSSGENIGVLNGRLQSLDKNL